MAYAVLVSVTDGIYRTSLVPMLEKERIYNELCGKASETGTQVLGHIDATSATERDSKTRGKWTIVCMCVCAPIVCDEQSDRLQYAFTMAVSSSMWSNLPLGLVLDK